jgi:hypothetical protein
MVVSSSFGDDGASSGGALALGNLPTVAGGLGETPPCGVATREAMIWCGGGASSSSGSRWGKVGRGMIGATIYRGKSLSGVAITSRIFSTTETKISSRVHCESNRI